MNRYILITLSLCGGIISGLAWTGWCPGLILLCGFVPFFFIENHLFENNKRYAPGALFIYLLPGFVVFSILTIGWIRVISITAAVCTILSSAFLMSFTMLLAHKVRLKEGTVQGFVSLLAFWLTLEFLCLKIDILSPWINLGNGLSKDIFFIQWYEATGTSGGTLWILLSNVFLFLFLTRLFAKKRIRFIYLLIWLGIVILPSSASIIRYKTIRISTGNEIEAVIIQPNSDPYGEKFTVPFEKQLEKVLDMAEAVITDSTNWLVTPETTVDDPVNENSLTENKYIEMIRNLTKKRPSVSVVAGMASYNTSLSGLETEGDNIVSIPSSVDQNIYFNSAFKIDTGADIEIYHKSRLVPGFEFIPSKGIFGRISRLLPKLGGINRGYSTQEERTCFTNSDKSQIIAPVICYESAFGEYVTDYILKGAGAIFIITNDGWWKNTKGYRQHLSYASLRAIETRRPVVRAANTGVSCFIDIRGRVTMKTPWWKPATLKGTFNPETRITPYVKYGDFLMVTALFFSVVVIVMVFAVMPVLKK
jgi:apolipoprotein N-acyltransferase